MDIYEQFLRMQMLQQKRNVEAQFMAGGGLDGPYNPYAQQQYANMAAGMQNVYVSPCKPKKKTQAMKKYEKLIAKRDRIRLCISLSASLFLVLMSVSWFFGFNGLLLSGSALGVITAITTLVWWMDR